MLQAELARDGLHCAGTLMEMGYRSPIQHVLTTLDRGSQAPPRRCSSKNARLKTTLFYIDKISEMRTGLKGGMERTFNGGNGWEYAAIFNC